MKGLSALWARMGLATRLVVASSVSTGIALVVATLLSVNLATQEARTELDSRFRENITFLADTVAASLHSKSYGQIEEVLNEHLLMPGVKAAGFRGTGNAVLIHNEASMVQTAPDLFVRMCALEDRQGSRQIEVDGQSAGELTLTLSPLPIINHAWDVLLQQVSILMCGAVIVFTGIWLALRANLKPFTVLLAGTRALGRGDLTQRMPSVGSREFRTTITAFNTMAEDLQGVIDALDKSQRLYSALVETSPVGVFKMDQKGKLTYVNSALCHIAGIADANMDHDEWRSHIHPDDRTRAVVFMMQTVRSGVAGMIGYRYQWPDGTVVWVQNQIAIIPGEAGVPNGFVGTVTNITAEIELRAKAELLSGLYEILSQVNSAIVHHTGEQELFEATCHILVTKGWLMGSAICVINDTRDKSILATSSGVWGPNAHTLVSEVDLHDPEAPAFLTTTLVTGKFLVANDALNDDRVRPRFREAIRKMGLGSVCTVPLNIFGETRAVLILASDKKDFFGADILSLIEEVARDVSFALEGFSREERRKQAEKLLARNEESLRVTLHSIGDAVLVTDIGGSVTMMNPVAEALTGWTEADARGRPAREIFHIINQETRRLVDNPIDMVLRNGKIVGLANHTLLIAKDGTERPIADSGAPIRYNKDGEVNGVVLVFRDQSDEYRMVDALRESEQLYSTLLKTAPVGVFHADIQGNTTYGNQTMLAISGMDKQLVTEQEWGATIHPQDRERITRAWQEAVENRSNITDSYRYLHPDGKVFWVRTSLTSVINDKHEITGFIGAVVDITAEQKHLLEIEKLSRLYATLSDVNSAIVRCKNEKELYEEVAQLFVGIGGFEVATLIEIDPGQQIEALVTTRYFRSDYQHREEMLSAFSGNKQLPALTRATVITGKSQTSNNYQHDAKIESSWRSKAVELGIAATTTIPFSCSQQVKAVLSVSANEPDFFSPDILALLEEVGRDVSYALENLARESQRKQAVEELTRSEQRLRLGLSVTNIGMYEVDFTTNRIRFDATSSQLMNLGKGEHEFDMNAFINAVFPEGEAGNILLLQDNLLSGKCDDYSADSPLPMTDGSVRWLRNRGAVTGERTADGTPLRLLGVVSDITRTKKLEEQDRLAATVFEKSGESIMVIDARNKVVMVNQAFTRISGYSASDALGIDAHTFRTDRHDDEFYKVGMEILHRDDVWQGEIWRRRKTGEEYPALITVSIIRDKNGEITHYVDLETDISTQKEFEHRISHLAYRDALTDLPNRTLLRDRVEQSIALAHREGSTVALLFLDLDHFKNINDSLGHAVGDRLLKETAQRLSSVIREMDTVGRLGGDEFLVVLPDADAEAAAHVAQKLLDESARPFVFGSHSLTVTPSVGIALYPKDGTSFDDLLKTADTAMYRAKDEGRNAYRFYTPEMNQAVFQRMVLESSLRRAIENHEFVLHYQPKFELSQQRLVGVEALIRWHQPEMGMVSPAQFIPVAEESGLIEAIGSWVLEEACRQNKVWRDDGLPLLRVAVNLSARQLAARNVIDIIADTLKKSGLDGDGLEMEITESLLAKDTEHILKVLQSLKKLGVHVAVDDFGTGYSSLSYLKRFPIDRLKIDQSFVRDLVTDADDRAIATAVVTLGHSLGIRVIAEGVETKKQMEILRDMGCDEVQGYYFGRPIPADEMTQALRKLAAKSSREA